VEAVATLDHMMAMPALREESLFGGKS